MTEKNTGKEGAAVEDNVTKALQAEWQFINMDDVWLYLGRFGRYQVTQLILLFVFSTYHAIPILSGVFTGKNIDFKCATKDVIHDEFLNGTIVASACYVEIFDDNMSEVLAQKTCTDYEYEGGKTHLSYIVEWDMVCDKETLGQLPQIVTMLGMLIGASVLPPLGDKFGRKKLSIGSSLGMLSASLALAFVEHFELFLFLKFLTGAFQQGCLVPLFTMHLEVMPLDSASFVAFLTSFEWVVSMLLVGAVGYTFKEFEWRTMQLAFALAIIPAIICLIFLDESLRWLQGNSKIKEAEVILRKACRQNKKDYNTLADTVLNIKKDEVELLSPLDVDNKVTDEKTTPPQSDSYGVKSIVANKNMRKITFVMCYGWTIASMTYYGLTLLSTSLAGDPYFNYILACLVEVPSGTFIYFTMQRFGRKRILIFSNFISGTALILAVLVASLAPASGVFAILQLCLILVGKFFISCSFNIVWIFTPELYPTNIRNVGIGISSMSGRIGAIFSPLFTLLARKALWAPGTLFSVGCFVSVYLLSLLPETRWRELPKNVKEIDNWFEKDKQNSKYKRDRALDIEKA